MVCNTYKPTRALQPFVQCFLEANCLESTTAGSHTLFPNGHPGIFFNFGEAGTLAIKEVIKTPNVSVYGQIDRHFTASHQPRFLSLGVIFKPSVLSWLFRINMHELTNKAFNAELLRPEFKTLHEQLTEITTVKGKIERIEKYLISWIEKSEHRVTLTDHALLVLQQEKISTVGQLSRQLQVSQRYLETQFKNSIGLSPKTYSLIVRFKTMEHQLKKLSSVHWRDMSFASEFYDQNHFIKDFKRFTGLTPSGYMLQKFEMGSSYLSAG